jgi:hypothetical protein
MFVVEASSMEEFSLPALERHPGPIESLLRQVLLPDPEIEHSHVAPHKLSAVVRVKLQQ